MAKSPYESAIDDAIDAAAKCAQACRACAETYRAMVDAMV